MICMLQGEVAESLEDYRQQLKKRSRIFGILFLLGVLTTIFALVLNLTDWFEVNDYLTGFYTGFGPAIMAVSVIRYRTFQKLLKNEQKLKTEHVKAKDEREQAINMKASRAAGRWLLVLVYLVGVLGGMIVPSYAFLMAAMVGSYVIIFWAARVYYNKQM
ncbi:MAG: hypothetical protein PUB10_00350 [Clostridiales bacterium]|nr:hypothetical protein [Clostridiales bacterium]